MPPLRHIHGRPPGTPSRCRPSATPSLRCVVRFGAQRNYRCPGQARRPSKFPSPSFSAWSTPSATPPDTAHFRSFGEMMNRSAQIMVGGKSSAAAAGFILFKQEYELPHEHYQTQEAKIAAKKDGTKHWKLKLRRGATAQPNNVYQHVLGDNQNNLLCGVRLAQQTD